MNQAMVSTASEITGYRTIRTLGVVRGVTVRSRRLAGNMGSRLQAIIFGGNSSVYTELCEHSRQEAFDFMMQHADQMGANAIIGARYDANEVMDGVTEVLAYGTAVVVEKA